MTYSKALLFITMLALFIAAGALTAQPQTFTKLYDFGSPGSPIGPGGLLAQGRDGNLYSGTYSGGANDLGALFRFTPTGSLTMLHDFDGTHGANCQGGVTLGTDGNFYSTTAFGGKFGAGTLFRMAPDGAFTMMHNFSGGADRGDPRIPPIQASDGNLYGETGDSVYKLTRGGVLTTLHQFSGNEGGDVYGPLMQATDGNFYGATDFEVFKISPAGQLTALYNAGANGCCFGTTLVQGKSGTFYGTFSWSGGGVYTFSPGGPIKILHSFHGGDGSSPILQPMEATDGNFYGVTGYGGSTNQGTIYRVSPDGAFTVLHNFDGVTGFWPWQMLVQHTNGMLYGTASGGGQYGYGTFFSLDVGLAPFIRLVSASGQIGKNVGILGQGFTGTTSVSFSGVPASFTVSSDTYLETTVPDGALTGSVTVTASTGTLTSDKIFRVTPKVLSFNPTSGAAGTPVVITGAGFTQTLRIGFGAVVATSFTVDSDTQITAIVPTGAVTGKIAVVTQGGHDAGARVFTVTP